MYIFSQSPNFSLALTENFFQALTRLKNYSDNTESFRLIS